MLFQSVSANQVFFLDDRSAAVRDYSATVGRLDALALSVSNAGAPPRNHPHHERLTEIREFMRDNGRRFSPRSPSAADLEKINAIRTAFAEYRELAGQDLLERIFNYAETQRRTPLMVDAPAPGQESPFSQQVPQYCQNYPILERDLLESFYQGAREGEDFNCYELGGNGVGLDLSEIGPALVSLEERSYQRQTQQLQRALMMRAISGILEESSAYAGVYPGTDNNLGNLNRCSYGRSQELRNMIAEHRGELPQTVERLNNSFGPGENARRNALMAEQVRQALIIGNLYNIIDRARAQSDGSQLAVVGGSPQENFPQEVVIPCREQMERDYGFAYQGVITDYTYLPRRCAELLDQERFANMPACIEAYRIFEQNLTLQTQQQACYYRESGRADEAPRVISADNLIPLMSASVDSYPLLFNREDSRSLIPFVSSDSNYVPSQFAQNVKELAGAARISRAVEDLLATNPENPRQAIDELLAEEEMVNLMRQVITSAQQSEPMNNSLKDEITRYQNELGESAANVCRNEGEHLHQFPSLVNDVIADELSEVDDPREREQLLARRQAAQCWLLESDPPESEGGLPSGFFALGVGAIALGMVPVVGWAASAALVAAGTGVAATDSYLRFDHARDQLHATTAAFQGGWADSNLVLLRSENALNAETNLWLEGLSVGILDVATPAVRAGLRTFRTPQGIRESINRQVRGEAGVSSPRLGLDEVAALDDTQRRQFIAELYPDLESAQVEAIMRAHSEIPCPVGGCSPAQLRAKSEILAQAGITLERRREIIERGIAGQPRETLTHLPNLEGPGARQTQLGSGPDALPIGYTDNVIEHLHEHTLDDEVFNSLSSAFQRDLQQTPLNQWGNEEVRTYMRRILDTGRVRSHGRTPLWTTSEFEYFFQNAQRAQDIVRTPDIHRGSQIHRIDFTFEDSQGRTVSVRAYQCVDPRGCPPSPNTNGQRVRQGELTSLSPNGQGSSPGSVLCFYDRRTINGCINGGRSPNQTMAEFNNQCAEMLGEMMHGTCR